jgi:hypothetical protein
MSYKKVGDLTLAGIEFERFYSDEYGSEMLTSKHDLVMSRNKYDELGFVAYSSAEFERKRASLEKDIQDGVFGIIAEAFQ